MVDLALDYAVDQGSPVRGVAGKCTRILNGMLVIDFYSRMKRSQRPTGHGLCPDSLTCAQTALLIQCSMTLGTVPCRCGGENENCYRCWGTGMIEPPSSSLSTESAYLGESIPRLSTPIATTACPECGVLVSRLSRHMRKKHGVSAQLSLEGINGVANTNAAPSEPLHNQSFGKLNPTSQQLVGGSLMRSGTLQTCLKDEKVSANPATLSAKSKQISELETCAVCGVSVKHLQRHILKTGHDPVLALFDWALNPVKKKPEPPASSGLKCPRCHAVLPNENQLVSHIIGSHGLEAFKKLGVMPSRFKGSGGILRDSKHGSYDRSLVDSEPNLDAKKWWGHTYRDFGQFGSYPSHDDMDDESSA